MLPTDLSPFPRPQYGNIPSFLPLVQRFHSCEGIDTSKIERFSQKTFGNLIQEKRAVCCPYFVVITEDTHHTVEVFDATHFVQYFFQENHQLCPDAKQIFSDGAIYQLNIDAGHFTLFYPLSALEDEERPWLSTLVSVEPKDFSEDRKEVLYHSFGSAYEEEKDFETAKRYYGMGGERGLIGLANLFDTEGNISAAIQHTKQVLKCTSNPETKAKCQQALQELEDELTWYADATHKGMVYGASDDEMGEEDAIYGTPPKSFH